MSKLRHNFPLWLVAGSVFALPLLGAVFAGRSAREFFVFPPPREIPTDYVRFSGWAALAVGACIAAVALPWWRRRSVRKKVVREPREREARGKFPWWGAVAIAWTAGWWVLAWTRWEWFAPAQRYTFFPLWIGFILAVNAAIEWRTGSCLARRAPWRWFALFAGSAACWWGFEWLNRFVRNWHYLAVEDFGPLAYAVHATLCFSTVLPAVAAVAEWIASHAGWGDATGAGPRWSWLESRGAAVALGVVGAVGLVGAGSFPRGCYPALWIAPLALWLSAEHWTRGNGLGREIARGDWTRAATWMVAALVCGFFWELWNWQSLAKWIYTVPGVERWHVFEMPLLGYVGYLPFGLECLLVAERIVGGKRATTIADARE